MDRQAAPAESDVRLRKLTTSIHSYTFAAKCYVMNMFIRQIRQEGRQKEIISKVK